jgi:hypothetical protein
MNSPVVVFAMSSAIATQVSLVHLAVCTTDLAPYPKVPRLWRGEVYPCVSNFLLYTVRPNEVVSWVMVYVKRSHDIISVDLTINNACNPGICYLDFLGSSCPYLTLNVVVFYHLLWYISLLIILTSGLYIGFGSNLIIYDPQLFP